jgi:hypothetical protein
MFADTFAIVPEMDDHDQMRPPAVRRVWDERPLRPEFCACTSSKARYAGAGSVTVAQGRVQMLMLLYSGAVPDR